MKVKELIEKLTKCDQELEVYVCDSEDNLISESIKAEGVVSTMMKKDNKVVIVYKTEEKSLYF